MTLQPKVQAGESSNEGANELKHASNDKEDCVRGPKPNLRHIVRSGSKP
eukprot:CAMPEP_0118937118 /NCGR_PEP_ID=MMETSP1169-20130426/21684_1 /TAXON_ID=36882 /ORGANISM="Pyramimonas obovata, Strain CCMP722" /LENGTH=48 /DNA_ID= /DNA_START= /DNA_END= /DNA_ORIENTATION=